MSAGGDGTARDHEDLMSVLSKYGHVVECLVTPGLPYAYVSFEHPSQAEVAFTALDGRCASHRLCRLVRSASPHRWDFTLRRSGSRLLFLFHTALCAAELGAVHTARRTIVPSGAFFGDAEADADAPQPTRSDVDEVPGLVTAALQPPKLRRKA